MSSEAWVAVIVIAGYLFLWAYNKGGEAEEQRRKREQDRNR
jgi:hypothetical protein